MPFESIIADGGFSGLDHVQASNQPRLFQYGSNIYQFVTSPAGSLLSVYKSLDLGHTWHHIVDIHPTSFTPTKYGAVLVGTSAYLWYETGAGGATALGFFDFTADTFTTVATTGTITLPNPAPAGMCLCGPDANHLFTISDDTVATLKINVNEYLSNVATSIGTMTEGSGNNVKLQTVWLGASGIVHVLYVRNASGPAFTLRYFNVNAGVISSSSTVLTGFSDQNATAGGICTPVQIGTNVYFCFYLPSAQQIQLCTFADVASPTFAFSVIEPTWPINPAPPATFGTGQHVSALSNLTGNLLICFYTNTNVESTGATGDGILYCRTSPDAGVTWSPVQQIIQHIDPAISVVRPISAPDVLNQVSSTFPFNPLFCSYMQNPNPAGGASENFRFVPYCPSAVTPPPPAGGWHSSIE